MASSQTHKLNEEAHSWGIWICC